MYPRFLLRRLSDIHFAQVLYVTLYLYTTIYINTELIRWEPAQSSCQLWLVLASQLLSRLLEITKNTLQLLYRRLSRL